ncbi:MAG: M42 family metallopeptidase [Planctomycetota bacterium]
MKEQSLKLLKDLISAPSPSGFEQPAQRVFTKYTKPFCDEVVTDVMGNTTGILNKKGKPVVMLSGHCDEIGFMITYIDKEGFLRFRAIGGVDAHLTPGKRVNVHGKGGKILGIIGRKPIHLLDPKDRDKVTELKQQFIDIGAKDKKAAEKLVSIGDPITFVDELEHLQGDIVASRGFDDKMGSFIVAETLRILSEKRKNLKAAVFGVSSVQEEVGLRGARTAAYGINPDVGIAIDVGHSIDYPGVSPNDYGDHKLGKGPILSRGANINPALFDMLVSTAKKKKLAHQIEGAPSGTGTDANVIQLTRAGVATALVSVPLRYMHTPAEVLSLKDLETTATLLAEVILSFSHSTDFIPR